MSISNRTLWFALLVAQAAGVGSWALFVSGLWAGEAIHYILLLVWATSLAIAPVLWKHSRQSRDEGAEGGWVFVHGDPLGRAAIATAASLVVFMAGQALVLFPLLAMGSGAILALTARSFIRAYPYRA